MTLHFIHPLHKPLNSFFVCLLLMISAMCRGASSQDGMLLSYDWMAPGGLTKPFCLPVG